RIGGRRFELLPGEGHDIALLLFVVVERRPRDCMVLLADTEKAAEADDGEHDAVRRLLQHDVLDRADAVAGRIVDGRTDDARGGDGVCVSAGGMGVHLSLLVNGTGYEENERREQKFRW